MWLAIATPIVMIACLALVIALWIATNAIVALVVFGLLCVAASFLIATRRKRSRGF
jgi:uncharacterized membrane protein